MQQFATPFKPIMNLDGSHADLVSAEGGANVTVSGDVKLHRAHFEQGTFNISGSLSIASVVFKNGNLDAKINHPDHHDVSRRSGGRWITICPNNHVHYSLKSALNPPRDRWGSVHGFKDAAEVALRVAADIKHANADVERYCIAPATHTSGDTCRCGLFFGLFLLGDQSAVEYFARAAGVVTNLTEIYDGIPKSQGNKLLQKGMNPCMRRCLQPSKSKTCNTTCQPPTYTLTQN